MLSLVLLNFGDTSKGILSHLCLKCQDLLEKSLFRVPVGVASIMLAFGCIVKNQTVPALMELTTQWGGKH